MDNSNNINKTNEQLIDEAVETIKAILIPQAKSPEQAEDIQRRLNYIGHEVKAINAFINEQNVCKAVIHTLLSQMQ